MKEPRLVRIRWKDIESKVGWHTLDELKEWSKEKFATFESIGWLVLNSSKQVIVCGTRSEDDDTFGEPTRIFKGAVLSIEDVDNGARKETPGLQESPSKDSQETRREQESSRCYIGSEHSPRVTRSQTKEPKT